MAMDHIVVGDGQKTGTGKRLAGVAADIAGATGNEDGFGQINLTSFEKDGLLPGYAQVRAV